MINFLLGRRAKLQTRRSSNSKGRRRKKTSTIDASSSDANTDQPSLHEVELPTNNNAAAKCNTEQQPYEIYIPGSEILFKKSSALAASSDKLQESFNTSVTSLMSTQSFLHDSFNGFNASSSSFPEGPLVANNHGSSSDFLNASLNSLATHNSHLSRDSWASNTPSFSMMVLQDSSSSDFGGSFSGEIKPFRRSSPPIFPFTFEEEDEDVQTEPTGEPLVEEQKQAVYHEHESTHHCTDDVNGPPRTVNCYQHHEQQHEPPQLLQRHHHHEQQQEFVPEDYCDDDDSIPRPKHERLLFKDGAIFDGLHVRGMLLRGQMIYANGCTYEGSFFNGKRHGRGVCVFPNGSSTYMGCWNRGSMHGKGIMVYKDGGMLWGDFRHGELHGYGTELLPDGTIYHEGIWDRGYPKRSRW